MPENWDRKLSRKIGRFRTLRDIRDFVLREFPQGPPPTWKAVAEAALEAAKSGDTGDVEAVLAMIAVMDRRAH